MNLLFEGECQLAGLPVLAEKFKSLVKTPALVFVSGEMGAGKTSFISEFCSALGVKFVSSPTYSIHNRYSSEIIVDHFDLFRLESEDEIASSGFFDLLEMESDYKFVEWAERIKEDVDLFQHNRYRITILVLGELRKYSLYQL